MCTALEVETISEHCSQVLNLNDAQLGDEYYYQSLPLCVIDAVYSIGVNYSSTRNTVIRYCGYFNITRLRENRHSLPDIEFQQSMEDLLHRFEEFGVETFKEEIFNNRQRTSARNGIPKAEAVLLFSQTIRGYNINYFQDIDNIIENDDFDNAIRRIPGQTSGISLKYFFMLAGFEDLIKPTE